LLQIGLRDADHGIGALHLENRRVDVPRFRGGALGRWSDSFTRRFRGGSLGPARIERSIHCRPD
jgi:hypothetical protein